MDSMFLEIRTVVPLCVVRERLGGADRTGQLGLPGELVLFNVLSLAQDAYVSTFSIFTNPFAYMLFMHIINQYKV